MYHSILVPLDGSKRAESILPHIEELARRFKAKIILLGVVAPFVIGHEAIYPIFDEGRYRQQIKKMTAYLATQKEALHEKGIEAQIRVGHRHVVTEIIDTAQREEVDLIAMTSHGRTGPYPKFFMVV